MASMQMTRPANRPVKTCTECKQVKLRCDSRAKFPAPCSRCQARRLHCIVDSSFRRTPARRRVEEMARELEALKSRGSDDSRGGSTTSPSVADASIASPDTNVDVSGTAAFDYSDLDLDTLQLGIFVIDRDSVIETFQIFSAFFYPQFPIVEPTTSIGSLYRSSPFLFWTIIAVVSARQIVPSHGELFHRLQESYTARLRSDILRAPMPLPVIQGLLFLIMFPFPAPSLTSEPSWLYCGIAVNASLYMGLHHPKPLQSLRSVGVVPGTTRSRAITWLGCFLSSTAASMINGLAPLINTPPDLDTIEKFAREQPLPREFAHQVMVHHALAKFTNVLNDSKGAISYSLVQLVDVEIDGLRSRFPTDWEWTPRVEFSVLVAKLHVYAMAIIRMQSDPTSRDILLKRGFTVAVRIIYLLTQGLGYTSDQYPDMTQGALLRTLPKNYFRYLILASVFLLRYFSLNIRAAPEEQETARNQIAIGHQYLESGSTEPQDEQARGARLLERLSRQQPVDIERQKLRVDNRMGASLVYDALTTGFQLRDEATEAEDPVSDMATATASTFEQNAIPVTGDVTGDSGAFGFGGIPGQMGSLDFALPEDIWGDSLWGMFDIGMAPAYY